MTNKIPHILIIDDDEINNFIASKLIDKMPFKSKVSTCLNGELGINFIKSCKEEEMPDIIFLDINMPVMNGWEFLDEYEESVKNTIKKKISINIISSSVYSNDILKSETYNFINKFISKPLSIEKIQTLFNEFELN